MFVPSAANSSLISGAGGRVHVDHVHGAAAGEAVAEAVDADCARSVAGKSQIGGCPRLGAAQLLSSLRMPCVAPSAIRMRRQSSSPRWWTESRGSPFTFCTRLRPGSTEDYRGLLYDESRLRSSPGSSCDAKAAESFFCPSLEELLEETFRHLEELDDPEKLPGRRQEREGDVRILLIGPFWHALHFLLTGDSELKPHPLPPPPLGNVVQGGTPTQWPCKCGHVRSLMPDEVRAAADALRKISVEELRSRFSVASFNAAHIYPRPGRAFWTDGDAEPIFEIYPRVVEFYRSAARDGDMILLSLD